MCRWGTFCQAHLKHFYRIQQFYEMELQKVDRFEKNLLVFLYAVILMCDLIFIQRHRNRYRYLQTIWYNNAYGMQIAYYKIFHAYVFCRNSSFWNSLFRKALASNYEYQQETKYEIQQRGLLGFILPFALKDKNLSNIFYLDYWILL